MLKVSLFCRPQQLPQGDVSLVAEAGRLADQAGLYAMHFGEHLLMGERPDRYPFGAFEHDPLTPWLDPLIALASVAAVTERLRLSTGVLLGPLRSGVLLAKQLASLDVLSHGRVEPGIGVGWQPEEYEASGIAWSDRYRLLDLTLRSCRQLWAEQPTTLPSESGELDRVVALPRPVQERIPVLLGLRPTPRNIARIVEYADGWCPVRLSPTDLAAGVADLRAAFAAAGRDPDSLIVRTQAPLILDEDGRVDVERTMQIAGPSVAAGATILAVGPTAGCRDMADVASMIKRLAEIAERFDDRGGIA